MKDLELDFSQVIAGSLVHGLIPFPFPHVASGWTIKVFV